MGGVIYRCTICDGFVSYSFLAVVAVAGLFLLCSVLLSSPSASAYHNSPTSHLSSTGCTQGSE
jgi:hypothetical protein